MKPCGIIITYMDWRKWKTWWFNIPLMLFQLTFMVVGTAIGKIKWPKAFPVVKVLSVVGIANGLFFIWYSTFVSYHYWLLPFWVFSILYFVATSRGMDIGRVWRAAQASHVRLCLRGMKPLYGGEPTVFQYINFGYPKAELQYWRMEQCDGKRFEYREPTFESSPEFIERMIDYADKLVNNPVARKYDWLQLTLGYVVNFAIWIFIWPLWGKEVVPWFNLPGGLEVCISGLVAVLRWAENVPRRTLTIFFKIYHIPVIPPCLIVLSENWRLK